LQTLAQRQGDQALHVPRTGTWDGATAEAVSAFQRSEGLVADGVVGPRTAAALDKALKRGQPNNVLLGRIAPLDGIGPDQLTIEALVDRVREGNFAEVIMATNPTIEGDGTALYISNLLSEFPVEITRLARGITAGSVLEYANREMITDALSGRQKL